MYLHHTLLLSCLVSLGLAIPAPTAAPTPTSALISQAASEPTKAPAPASYFTTTSHIIIPGQTKEHVTIPDKTIDITIPTCIRTLEPDENGYLPPGTCDSIYPYYPSFGAALAAAIFFGGLTIAHITQAAWTKKSFCWVIIMAAIWETISFTARTAGTKNQQSHILRLVSDLFVLLAPLWINAFAYMVLGRMIYFFTPTGTIFSIHASTLALLFVFLDFVSFVTQIAGGSMTGPASPPEQVRNGLNIYMGGIGMQQAFIVIFLVIAVKFHLTMVNQEKMGRAKAGWKKLLFALYGSLSFITIRIIFRLIQFSSGKGFTNPLMINEAYFFALEAVPSFLAMFCYNIVHPGTVLIGKESELPSLKAVVWDSWIKKRDIRPRKLMVEEDGEYLAGSYTALPDDKQTRGREMELRKL